ncbi:uncharacterized protein H6S33_010668 [Morchella sextelata]|uniref:uncharacterized protein n=1 Tax=Morchella sextelata TaxID=1174677 RepID=UPI001D038154|nr:uncharacterized protein H6S33_010668 [Morchella sextelata]KAH0611403.1 hypothetical protein H6S33_010668 [Morchella sextelata]
MKSQLLTLLLLSISASSVHGAVAAWGQCGGATYSGDTACVSGYACTKVNDYYSQCQPGTASASTASTTAVTPTTATTTPSTTASGTAPTGTGQLIRGVSTPIYHLYLQSLSGVPVMAAEATAERFIISGSIQDTTSGLYLNVDSSATTSYKAISFGATATTTGWGLEGDTIITTNASVFGRQLNFLACETSTAGAYKLYLQTGSDTPSGETCTLQTLHLPCLC